MTIASSTDDVCWHYNDNFFSMYDWTKEPTQTLSELYKNRAIQLRNEYDYIVIMYSGGADSSNVLESFVKNNIPIDEVCHTINLKGTNDINSHVNKEIFVTAKPKIEQYILNYNLKIKHRFIDMTDHIVEYFNESNKFDFIHQSQNYYNPNVNAKASLYKKIPDWQDLVEAGKKICIVWGAEKPIITGNNNNFYFQFMDTLDGSISMAHQNSKPRGITDELFYWAPTDSCAKIIIKQSHICKKTLEFLLKTKIHPQYKSNEEINCRVRQQDGKMLLFGGQHVKKLIYPYFVSEEFNAPKSKFGIFLGERETWFWQKYNERPAKIFLNGIEHIQKSIQPDWLLGNITCLGKQFPEKVKKLPSKLYALQ